MLAVVVPREDFLTRWDDDVATSTTAAIAAAAAAAAVTATHKDTNGHELNGHESTTTMMTSQHRLESLCAQQGANEAVLESMVAVAHAASRPPHEGGLSPLNTP